MNSLTDKYSLEQMLSDIGFRVGTHPMAFSDCFDYSGIDRETENAFRNSATSSISKFISKNLPKIIDGEYTSIEAVATSITHSKEYNKNEMVKKWRPIIETGIIKAVGFNVIKKSDEIKKYPNLVRIKQELDAGQKVRTEMFRSAHKGEHGQDMIEAIIKDYEAQDKVVLDKKYHEDRERSHQILLALAVKKTIIDNDSEVRAILVELNNEIENYFTTFLPGFPLPKQLPDSSASKQAMVKSGWENA